nr:hypothetical protein [Rhodococcus sp. 06-621-2]
MSARRRHCPGGCGRTLRQTVFACKDCWASMPASLRRPISSTIGKPPSPSKTAAWNDGAAHFARRGV